MASYLGKGDKKTASDIVARVLRLAAGIGALLAVALLAGRQVLPTVFTNDPAVQSLVTMVNSGGGGGGWTRGRRSCGGSAGPGIGPARVGDRSARYEVQSPVFACCVEGLWAGGRAWCDQGATLARPTPTHRPLPPLPPQHTHGLAVLAPDAGSPAGGPGHASGCGDGRV